MTDRERLSKLIKQAEQQEQLDLITADLDEAIDMSGGTKINCSMEYIADYLIEHGVIIPPCKVGDVVYTDRNGNVLKCEACLLSEREARLNG